MNGMDERMRLAEELTDDAVRVLELDEKDVNYIRNRVLEILRRCGGEELTEEEEDEVYGALSLMPSQVNARFQSLMKESGRAATDWLYGYCVGNRSVKKAKLDRNPRFESNGLIITINKAKPEFRDPKKAKAANSVDGGFCKCVICRENEGFGARNKRTLRTVDLTLGGERWFWQYSPYGYFREHGIAVNCEHVPMRVDKSTFGKLMDFVDLFPHYFIGCNAPLPRIGGSVLAHDHYQGGGEILPMHRAKAAYTLTHPSCPNAVAEVLDWQGTVVRVVSESREEITELCESIRAAWVGYDNPELGIVAEDEEGVHNALSPTVVKTARGYEMSLILRSNITSEEFPDGVFHAHPEYHAIKKESIGLIEAQGLFILPGRLDKELREIEEVIRDKSELPPEYAAFELVYRGAKAVCERESVDAREGIKRELGRICSAILENTAVFREKEQTCRFLRELGWK